MYDERLIGLLPVAVPLLAVVLLTSAYIIFALAV
jgi:hypothetical protein